MRNFLEKFLISCLLIISILLGLSFWLNIKYNFNMFSAKHWVFLSQLQASNTKIEVGFYASFIIAFVIFLFVTLAIFSIKHEQKTVVSKPAPQPIQQMPVTEQPTTQNTKNIPTPQYGPITRPQRLNLPKNMASIVANKFEQQKTAPVKSAPQESPYNSVIKDIFENAGYTVKQNPVISGFTTNLFAIGNNENVWIGGVDCDIAKINNAVTKLNNTFQETLDDITIHIHSFILDTHHTYESDENVMVFHTTDEIRDYLSQHPADSVDESDQEGFDAYSEYIDTIIKYIKNV